MLAVLGIPPSLLDRYPHQVSGGQARRVSIARALVLEPRLIVADEPTAGLDASIQGELLNLLQQVRLLYGPSLLVVSHNLAVIRRITDQVGVMYLGKLVEFGRTRRLVSAPRHPYTEALISANPVIDPAKRRHKIVLAGEIPSPRNPPSGCRSHTRCPRARCVATARSLHSTKSRQGSMSPAFIRSVGRPLRAPQDTRATETIQLVKVQ